MHYTCKRSCVQKYTILSVPKTEKNVFTRLSTCHIINNFYRTINNKVWNIIKWSLLDEWAWRLRSRVRLPGCNQPCDQSVPPFSHQITQSVEITTQEVISYSNNGRLKLMQGTQPLLYAERYNRHKECKKYM